MSYFLFSHHENSIVLLLLDDILPYLSLTCNNILRYFNAFHWYQDIPSRPTYSEIAAKVSGGEAEAACNGDVNTASSSEDDSGRKSYSNVTSSSQPTKVINNNFDHISDTKPSESCEQTATVPKNELHPIEDEKWSTPKYRCSRPKNVNLRNVYRLETKLNDLDISEPIFQSKSDDIIISKNVGAEEADTMADTPSQCATPSHDITPGSDVTTPRNKSSWDDTRQFKATINWFDDDEDEDNMDNFLENGPGDLKKSDIDHQPVNEFDHHSDSDVGSDTVMLNSLTLNHSQHLPNKNLVKSGYAQPEDHVDFSDSMAANEMPGNLDNDDISDAESSLDSSISSTVLQEGQHLKGDAPQIFSHYLISVPHLKSTTLEDNQVGEVHSDNDIRDEEVREEEVRDEEVRVEEVREEEVNEEEVGEDTEKVGEYMIEDEKVREDMEEEDAQLVTPPEAFHDSDFDSDRDEFYSSYCESPGWE